MPMLRALAVVVGEPAAAAAAVELVAVVAVQGLGGLAARVPTQRQVQVHALAARLRPRLR